MSLSIKGRNYSLYSNIFKCLVMKKVKLDVKYDDDGTSYKCYSASMISVPTWLQSHMKYRATWEECFHLKKNSIRKELNFSNKQTFIYESVYNIIFVNLFFKISSKWNSRYTCQLVDDWSHPQDAFQICHNGNEEVC